MCVCVCCVSEGGVVAASRARFQRGVGTASETSRASRVGVACQVLRPASPGSTTHHDGSGFNTGPPAVPVSAALPGHQFPTEL